MSTLIRMLASGCSWFGLSDAAMNGSKNAAVGAASNEKNRRNGWHPPVAEDLNLAQVGALVPRRWMLDEVVMDAQNPYSPPQINDSLVPNGNPRFGDLDDKALNKLYYRSCNVSGIAALLLFGLVFLFAAIAMPEMEPVLPKPVIMGLALFYLIAIIGLFMRTSWGRVMGILVCILALINIPLGTVIGIVGLFAFIKAPNLFGPGRVFHKDLKAEFKLRKKARKAA